MIDTILFDADGVVLNSEVSYTQADTELVLRRGHAYDPMALKPLVMGKSFQESTDILKQHYKLPERLDALVAERLMLFRKGFIRHVDYTIGFKEFYKAVKDTYKTAIASSMRNDILRQVDEKLDLSELFNNQVYTIFGLNLPSKPAPDIFLYAAKELGSKPENCVVIEDAPLGIEGANAAGMKSIAITTSLGREYFRHADQVVDAFDEIDLKKFK